MKRGDIFVVATGRNYGGKPRPALVVQDDLYDFATTVIVLPITSTPLDASDQIRVRLIPDSRNGLHKDSAVMIDIVYAVPRDKVGQWIGSISADDMIQVDSALVRILGLGETSSPPPQ